MPVRLTTDAAVLVRATLESGRPMSRAGFNSMCRDNHLFGRVDGAEVAIACRAIDNVGVQATIALAHADIDFVYDDHRKENDDDA